MKTIQLIGKATIVAVLMAALPTEKVAGARNGTLSTERQDGSSLIRTVLCYMAQHCIFSATNLLSNY